MTMLEIIEKKKFGQELTKEEISFFAGAAAEKSVPDYQLSALLMAIRLNGMTDRETTDLTLAMRDSGDVADLSAIPGVRPGSKGQLSLLLGEDMNAVFLDHGISAGTKRQIEKNTRDSKEKCQRDDNKPCKHRITVKKVAGVGVRAKQNREEHTAEKHDDSYGQTAGFYGLIFHCITSRRGGVP